MEFAFGDASASSSGSGMTPVEGMSRLVLLSTMAQTMVWTITGTTHTPSAQRHAEEPLKNSADSGPIAPEAPNIAVYVIINRT